MKKILFILLVLILSACNSVRKDDLYTLNINGADITVGFDNSSVINEYIDSYNTYIDDKDNEILNKVFIYPNDNNLNISIDGTYITSSISETCTLLNGEYSEDNNGHVCLISKRVKKHDNYIIIYGDILDDNLDKLDRIEVYYK